MALTSSGRKDIGATPWVRCGRWPSRARLHAHFLELPGDRAEQGLDAAVDDAVADAHVGAADQGRLELRLEHDALAGHTLELGVEPFALGLGERHRAHHGGAVEPLHPLDDRLELV